MKGKDGKDGRLHIMDIGLGGWWSRLGAKDDTWFHSSAYNMSCVHIFGFKNARVLTCHHGGGFSISKF